MPSPELVVLDHKDQLPEVASERTAHVIREAIRDRGECFIALAGGNTPRPIYAMLARRSDIDWSKVRFYFGDERCVPPEDPESNFLMAKTSLLDRLDLEEGQVFRMEAERESREEAAKAYCALLPERFDLIHLGMGPDGHTASLFPGDSALDETQRRVVPVYGPKPPPWRLTLTSPVIQRARQVFVFAFGASKAAKVKEAVEGEWNPKEVPIQLALHGVWFLDREAVSELPQGPQ